MRRMILVTGGAGFIGSHYIRYLLKTHPEIQVINADALTYSGNLYNLKDVENDSRYLFVHTDLAEKEQVEKLFQHPIVEIVHFAAESHVDRSIDGADPFIRSNIIGTYRLLEAAHKAGVEKFVHISTDEVYGSFPVGRADEQTMLVPGNPYSASKASSDLFCLSFHNTYGLPVIISRCTNNYGPNQYPEKFIPHLIQQLMADQPLPIYGDGKQERDWLHVFDHCRAVDLIRQHGRIGEVYHIGAEHTVSNLEVAQQILDYMGNSSSYIRHVPDRPGHDVRYSLDTTKIRTQLGWSPSISFTEGLKQTVEWYLHHSDWWKSVEQRRRERR